MLGLTPLQLIIEKIAKKALVQIEKWLSSSPSLAVKASRQMNEKYAKWKQTPVNGRPINQRPRKELVQDKSTKNKKKTIQDHIMSDSQAAYQHWMNKSCSHWRRN